MLPSEASVSCLSLTVQLLFRQPLHALAKAAGLLTLHILESNREHGICPGDS